jgi:RNA polymerase sigma-70 factor (ECF subfamily)
MTDQRPEYERLIAPITDRMIRVVWRIVRDPDEADDAFQDALLAVWKRWGRIQSHPNPTALILRICVHCAQDTLRRRVRREKRMDADGVSETIADAAPSTVERLAGAEQGAEVLRAIGTLSKNQAQAILMHAVEEIPYGDVAAAMDCGEATVRKHVARARAKLRTLLAHLIPQAPKEEGIHA